MADTEAEVEEEDKEEVEGRTFEGRRSGESVVFLLRSDFVSIRASISAEKCSVQLRFASYPSSHCLFPFRFAYGLRSYTKHFELTLGQGLMHVGGGGLKQLDTGQPQLPPPPPPIPNPIPAPAAITAADGAVR